MKLGEYLVREGDLDPPQLKAALDAQLIYGGHLGTCLIEKGYINEAQLGRALTETFGVRCANFRMFAKIPRFVIGTLSAKLVQKHMAVPIRLKDKVLDVALIDPKNLTALDELSFAAGFQIRPWIGPEARIYQAMERYYGVPRRQRFITLCDRMDSEVQLEFTENFAEKRENESAGASSSIYSTSRGTAVATAAAVTQAPADRDRLANLDDAFCEACDEDELGRVTLAYTSKFMERGILFRSRGGNASILRADGIGLSETRAEALEFPVISEPLFALIRGEDHFRGAVPKGIRKAAFFERLNLELPAEMILVPLYAGDQLVGLFYGDAGQANKIEGPTGEYLRLFKKLALAFAVVRLKKQIRVL